MIYWIKSACLSFILTYACRKGFHNLSEVQNLPFLFIYLIYFWSDKKEFTPPTNGSRWCFKTKLYLFKTWSHWIPPYHWLISSRHLLTSLISWHNAYLKQHSSRPEIEIPDLPKERKTGCLSWHSYYALVLRFPVVITVSCRSLHGQ